MVDLLCALLSCSEVVLAEFSYFRYFEASFPQLLVGTDSGLNTFRWKICNWTLGRPGGQSEDFNEEL